MILNEIWFILFIVIVGGYLILDGFDMGVGILHMFVARTDTERRTLLNSIGPVWDGNEVWLILGGGVLFAIFPFAYASLFSGFYVAFMLVLVVLILRAVTLEFRSQRPGATLADRPGTSSSACPRWCWRCCWASPSAPSSPASRWVPTRRSAPTSSSCSRRSPCWSAWPPWPCSRCTAPST